MKIIFVSPVLVPSLVKAAQDLRDEFNLVIDLEIYHPSQIDNEEIDVQAFSECLKSADAQDNLFIWNIKWLFAICFG